MNCRNPLGAASLALGMAAFGFSSLAAASLSTQVDYYCWSNGAGPNCELPTNGLHASATDTSPQSIGDGHGSASAQSTYGNLTANASSSWLPDSVTPAYVGSGNSFASFIDSITLSGGSGNAEVTAVMDLNGMFTEPLSYTNGTGSFLLSVRFSYGGYDSYSQIFLYKTLGGAEIDFGTNQNGSWTSADGVFSTPGNNGGLPQISPSGQLKLSALLPYNTPVQLSATLFAAGNNSVATTGSASVKLIAPSGTTISSDAGQAYGVATASKSADVPLPLWSVFLLGSLLVGSGSGSVARRRLAA